MDSWELLWNFDMVHSLLSSQGALVPCLWKRDFTALPVSIFSTMNKHTLDQFQEEFQRLVAGLEAKYSVKAETGSVRFIADDVLVKISIVETVDPGPKALHQVNEQWMTRLINSFARDAFLRRFSRSGKNYTVVGMHGRRIVTRQDGHKKFTRMNSGYVMKKLGDLHPAPAPRAIVDDSDENRGIVS